MSIIPAAWKADAQGLQTQGLAGHRNETLCQEGKRKDRRMQLLVEHLSNMFETLG